MVASSAPARDGVVGVDAMAPRLSRCEPPHGLQKREQCKVHNREAAPAAQRAAAGAASGAAVGGAQLPKRATRREESASTCQQVGPAV